MGAQLCVAFEITNSDLTRLQLTDLHTLELSAAQFKCFLYTSLSYPNSVAGRNVLQSEAQDWLRGVLGQAQGLAEQESNVGCLVPEVSARGSYNRLSSMIYTHLCLLCILHWRQPYPETTAVALGSNSCSDILVPVFTGITIVLLLANHRRFHISCSSWNKRLPDATLRKNPAPRLIQLSFGG